VLVACGTCACFGGVAAFDNGRTRDELARVVYGAAAGSYEIAPHRPLADFVKVDVRIPGCPMEKEEFLQAVACLLNGDLPPVVATPVCAECKMKEQDCLLVSRHAACAGPVTSAGCGARCPGLNVPCIGCRGPAEEPNFTSMTEVLLKAGFREAEIRQKLRTFAAPALAAE
jgi:sulfhydrogenase subunit delta